MHLACVRASVRQAPTQAAVVAQMGYQGTFLATEERSSPIAIVRPKRKLGKD